MRIGYLEEVSFGRMIFYCRYGPIVLVETIVFILLTNIMR